jgi:hypothetical protein
MAKSTSGSESVRKNMSVLNRFRELRQPVRVSVDLLESVAGVLNVWGR